MSLKRSTKILLLASHASGVRKLSKGVPARMERAKLLRNPHIRKEQRMDARSHNFSGKIPVSIRSHAKRLGVE